MNYYYIWLNIPAPERYYWNADAQYWTTLFGSATRFDSAFEAEQEMNKIRERDLYRRSDVRQHAKRMIQSYAVGTAYLMAAYPM